MFLQRAALRPVPRYAVIDESAMALLHGALDGEAEALQATLDRGYRELDTRQPTLAEFLTDELAERQDDIAQSLGYFLVVSVYLAFREAFPARLELVDGDALNAALEALEADEALRAGDPNEVLDSDDVVAMGQPLLLEFVQEHVSEAIEQSGDGADLEELDRVYRAVLVQVIALSHAVASPGGGVVPEGEILA